MTEENEGSSAKPKRTDVGYKRPPVETRFKKGQKPPPRKKKNDAPQRVEDIFWAVLQESRRVVIDGKVCWISNAELITRRAFIESEKGSSTLQRLLSQLLLSSAPGEESEQMPIVFLPDDDEGEFDVGVATYSVRPPAR